MRGSDRTIIRDHDGSGLPEPVAAFGRSFHASASGIGAVMPSARAASGSRAEVIAMRISPLGNEIMMRLR